MPTQLKNRPAPSRAARLRLLLALAAIPAVLAATPAPAESQATTYTPIQPGAQVTVYPGERYPEQVKGTPFAVCTLNFVFQGYEAPGAGAARGRGPEHTYIGDAGHCVRRVGDRIASPEIGQFGTVAYRIDCSSAPGCPGRPYVDDFSLIRIDKDKLHLVSPVVRGFGKAPSGFTTSEETSSGDLLMLHGQGAPFSVVDVGRTQLGVLEHDDPVWYGTTFVGPGHSGSPIVRISDGKALGIVAAYTSPSALQGTPVDPEFGLMGGPTVEHIMDLLAEANFDVRLVTEP